MPGGSSSPTQTTISNNDPWEPSQDFLLGGMNTAQDLLDAGTGFNPFPDSTVVGMSDQTQNALQGVQGLSESAAAGPYSQHLQNAIAGGGMTDAMAQAQGIFQNAAGGGMDVSTSGYQGILSDLEGGNPYLQTLLDNTQRRVSDQIAMDAAGAGRYGSGTHQGLVAEKVAEAANQALFGQYNQDMATRLSALGGMSGVEASNMARRLSSNQAAFDTGQQGLNNLPALFEAQTTPYQYLRNVGSEYEDLNRREIADQVRLWEGEQQAPWTRLQNAQAIFAGAGGLGGGQTSTVYGPQQSPWATLGGNALAGWGLTGSPWGAALGAATAIPQFF